MKINEINNKLSKEWGTLYKNIYIEGRWGIGKSYILKEKYSNRNSIYISLFGIQSIDELKKSFLYYVNKKMNIINKFKYFLSGVSFNSRYFDLTLPKINDDLDSLIKKNLFNKKKIYIIFDDIERFCFLDDDNSITKNNLKVKDVLGFISSISSFKNVNIVIVESNLIDNNSLFIKFKEKVIDKTYLIDKYDDSAVDKICKKSNIQYYKEVAKLFKDLNEYTVNLRSLNKAISFIKYIFNKIDILSLDKDAKIDLMKAIFIVILFYNENNCINNKKLNVNVYNEIISHYENKIKKISISKLLDSSVLSLLRVHYYNDSEVISFDELVSIVLSIYINDSEDNIEELLNYYKKNTVLEHVENNDNVNDKEQKQEKVKTVVLKDLFYCSEKELLERAEKFKKESVLEYNPNYDFYGYLNEIIKFNYYLNKYNKNEYFSKEEILESCKKYLNSLDKYSEAYEAIQSGSIQYFYSEIKDLTTSIRQIILKYFVNKGLNLLISHYDERYLYSKTITDIMHSIQSPSINYDLSSLNEEYQILLNYKFFIYDNLDGDIDEKIWEYMHKLCSIVANEDTSNYSIIKQDFYNILVEAMNNSNDVGKYRFDSLIKQYNLDINS